LIEKYGLSLQIYLLDPNNRTKSTETGKARKNSRAFPSSYLIKESCMLFFLINS